ncbi:MAG: TRZ/ATZ family hydrolase [Gammaproteobacteria bacterium]|nr:TRZ/ATZ family hydrolase [Gammaproteobacteria bacterium]
MKNIDTLLHARWIIPVDGNERCLVDHSIAIHEERILDILPGDKAKQTYQAQTEINYSNHALIPGLINAHTHAAMSLFRGLADDLALMDWLNNHIWPAESQWVNEDFVQLGTELACAEMLRGGTTCFNDMYFFPDVAARIAHKAGMRATVGLIALDFPTIWARDADEYIDKGLIVHDEYRGNELIDTAFAPHAPYTISDQPLQKIRMLADELDLPVHMHIHETAHEVDEAVKNTGKRPLQRLADLGLISPNLVAVHMTQIEPDEIDQLAAAGSHIVHCPESNLKLASGFCPVKQFLDAGINVALGTDSASSNNDLDMFSEMRTAALLAKGVSGDATAVPAHQALTMATLNGAKALGISDKTGSLSIGKYADLIAVDFSSIESTPVYDPISHLVYCCGREQVSDVWIAGKHIMKNRTITTLDIDRIRKAANEFSAKLNS